MISVEVNKTDQARLFKALERLLNVVKVQGMDTMQWKCATDFYQLVMVNVSKMSSPAPAYSDRYDKWKRKYSWMGYPSPWRLRGDLVKSLGAYKLGDGYLGGVQPGARDSGGKSWFGKGKLGPKGPSKSIEMYGRVSEYGKKKRPLFEPAMREYAKDGWKKRGDEMLKRMAAEWR